MRYRRSRSSVPVFLSKKQNRLKFTTTMLALFAALGFVVFLVGFRLAPKAYPIESAKENFYPAFVKPPPHLLANNATLEQVNAYVNLIIALGSFKYKESDSCRKDSTCQIYFPYFDLGAVVSNRYDEMQNTFPERSDLAILTKKGFKTQLINVKVNQDRSFIISPLEMREETTLPTSKDDFMMGLFDGHGELGHGTAHFATMELPSLLLRALQRRTNFAASNMAMDSIRSAIQEAFIHLDDNIPFLELSGSTGIIILRIGSSLCLASTGDSQAFLVKVDTDREIDEDQTVVIIKSTLPHKADDPLESTRIRANGGQVMPKMTPDSSSRVVVLVEGGLTLALAMSRSLGDPEGKKQNILIADPNVDIIDLNKLQEEGNPNDRYFVVAASDGLLDRVPPSVVARRIAQSFYKESTPRPLMACADLIQKSSKLWDEAPNVQYRDDISIAVKRIDL